MNASLLDIIGRAVQAAQQVGLDHSGQLDVARAVLLARDPELSPGTARVVVESLFDSVITLAGDGDLAA